MSCNSLINDWSTVLPLAVSYKSVPIWTPPNTAATLRVTGTLLVITNTPSNPAIAVSSLVFSLVLFSKPVIVSPIAVIMLEQSFLTLLAKSSICKLSINSPSLWPISSKSVFSSNDIPASNIPATHVWIVSPHIAKSASLKNDVIPSPIEFPNSVQSNVLPNVFKNRKAVLSAFAIVLPNSLNKSVLISPFKKVARPLPKLLAYE